MENAALLYAEVDKKHGSHSSSSGSGKKRNHHDHEQVPMMV